MVENNIEEILKNDLHVIVIHPAEKWDLPNIDYSLWSKKRREHKKRNIRQLEDFLQQPYIVDDFGNNHIARRTWRKLLELKYSWFSDYYEKNALKWGSTQLVFLVMETLPSSYLGQDLEQLKSLTENVMGMVENKEKEYSLKSNQEKMDYMKQIKKEAYGILKFLSQEKKSRLSTIKGLFLN